MWNNLDIDKLTETELAGMGTANPVIDWIKGFGVLSEFLSLSPNGRGSVSLDFDYATVAGRILALMEHTYGEFRGTIRGSDRLEMAGGHIFVGATSYDVGTHSKKLSTSDSGKCWMATITANGVSVSWDDLPGSCVTSSSLILPLCGAVKSGTRWSAYQYHLGSWVIPFPPACLISGYDTTKTQSLDHVNGTLVWHTYKTCNK